ncbi:MAG: competence type IV pilus major pilin ComGC [Lactovum sp.]
MKKRKFIKAFTLVEMLIVLLIISVLIMLFVPNLTKQKDAVKDTGRAAVVKIVESQAELYELEYSKEASLSSMLSEGNITQKQVDAYNEYYAEHTDEKAQIKK